MLFLARFAQLPNLQGTPFRDGNSGIERTFLPQIPSAIMSSGE